MIAPCNVDESQSQCRINNQHSIASRVYVNCAVINIPGINNLSSAFLVFI